MVRPIITLTTDFGMRDPYVAEMKAVILSICPQATMVDISHEIERFNIQEAAFVLACAAPYFPKATIHVAVVDPGVGTKRKPILMRTRKATFIGPDNGIFALVTRNDKPTQIREITNKRLMMPRVSDTFHGRDVFAPTAANVANGIKETRVGKVIHDIDRPTFAQIFRENDRLTGEVIYVDSFGNVVTNFGEGDLKLAEVDNIAVLRVNGSRLQLRICENYACMKRHEVAGIIGSHGLLEISMNQEDTAKRLRVETGDKIALFLTRAGANSEIPFGAKTCRSS